MKTGFRLAVATFGLAVFNVAAATLYVSLESTNPVAPYATWATAANVIQDAVDAGKAGDTVLVTNGVYALGQREGSVFDTNQHPPQLVSTGPSRVVVTNCITLLSVNGPLVTTIVGGGTTVTNEYGDSEGGRCVYMGTNAVLSGFTLTNGFGNGGGVLCTSAKAILTNCVLTGNVGQHGGGVNGGTLYDCTLTDNSAGSGGGAEMSTLYNCILDNNDAGDGGGANACTLYNCTLTSGWAHGDGGGVCGSTLYNCTLSGNYAWSPSHTPNRGGGAFASTLYNCRLTSNEAQIGGGACQSTLNNCTVTGNSASFGSGTYECALNNCTVTRNPAGDGGVVAELSTLYNCLVTGNEGGSDGQFYSCTVIENQGGISGAAFNSIVYYNVGGNYAEGTTLNHCCTTPLPTNGVGNIIGPPLFMDIASGDYCLWEGSPCIDAGTNLLGIPILVAWDWLVHITEPTDMLGNTRFIDGNGDGIVAWDIGAYEFNSFPPPRFTGPPQLTANGWKLNITGPPDKWVHVQRSSNLKDWEDQDYWMGSEGVLQVDDWDMGQKVRFYRAVIVP